MMPRTRIRADLSRDAVVDIVAHAIEGKREYVARELWHAIDALMVTRDLDETLRTFLPNNDGSERAEMLDKLAPVVHGGRP